MIHGLNGRTAVADKLVKERSCTFVPIKSLASGSKENMPATSSQHACASAAASERAVSPQNIFCPVGIEGKRSVSLFGEAKRRIGIGRVRAADLVEGVKNFQTRSNGSYRPIDRLVRYASRVFPISFLAVERPHWW